MRIQVVKQFISILHISITLADCDSCADSRFISGQYRDSLGLIWGRVYTSGRRGRRYVTWQSWLRFPALRRCFFRYCATLRLYYNINNGFLLNCSVFRQSSWRIWVYWPPETAAVSAYGSRERKKWPNLWTRGDFAWHFIQYQFIIMLIYVNLRKNLLTGIVLNVKRSGKKPTCADVIHRLEESIIRPP